MEDFEMFARKGVFSSIGRAAVMATVAAVALTAIEPSLALAGSAPSGKGLSAARATSDATDFSARRRYYRGGGGAAAAAFAGIVGTGLAIAAARFTTAALPTTAALAMDMAVLGRVSPITKAGSRNFPD